MSLLLNPEQRLLEQTAEDFLRRDAPVAALRKLRDEGDSLGYCPRLWRQMAELGWAGIIVPQQYDGLDFGFAGLGVLLQACGRTLTASPLLASSLIGASALLLGGSDTQKQRYLPRLASGRLTLALALEESNHHQPLQLALRADARNNGYVLNGRKLFVADGHSAEQLIVAARSGAEARGSDGISLFLVAGDARGIMRRRTLMADNRNAANIDFEQVEVPADSLLGEAGQGWPLLEAVLDRARIGMAAEMLGLCREAFERTLEYLRQREQFGVKIGSFQALQHRAADLCTELELATSVVLQACLSVDEEPDQVPRMASLAKARLNELSRRVTNEAVQMHGGIGVTDELEIGFFLKRARVAIQLFGDSGYHRDRYATLRGY